MRSQEIINGKFIGVNEKSNTYVVEKKVLRLTAK